MSIARFRNIVLAILLVGCQSNWAAAADYELTFDGKWRNSEDIVNGWDWSLPAEVRPAPGSGIFNLNSRVPDDFPGNHLLQVNAKWSELEPTEGHYDLSSIIKALNDSRYDGVMLNVRGMVVAIVDTNGNPIHQREISAPEWLSKGAPTTTENSDKGFRVTNLHIYDPRVKAKYIQLIQEIGKSPIPGHPRLKAQIIHGVSSSRGEEWTGTQSSRPEAIAAMEDLINAWTTAYGPHSRKLAWLKEDPVELFHASVVKAGTGIRGGAIEKWLRNQYTPGNPAETGQMLDADGYLWVDESFAPIAEGRHFQDQNEAYRTGGSIPREKWPQNYRLANLRMVQMRRNIAWTETNSTINPRMLNWMSLELGQSADTSPDAWVALMRTWVRYSNETREIKNLERWLQQRDIQGAGTEPALTVEHGFNAAANSTLSSKYWNMDLARRGQKIGIAVNDRFLVGGPHPVAIKVTYFDSSTEEWSLVYNQSNGEAGAHTIEGGGTQKVKTATFFLKDFQARASGLNFDFTLESAGGKTPFMFVRLIRLNPQSHTPGSLARPAPPGDVQSLN
ncbi:MAG: hypothetical protein WD795_05350 [Woeseia sp.]